MSKCPYWALLGLKEPYWGLTRPYFEFEDELTNRHTTYVIRTIRVRQIFRHKYLSQTFQFIFCSSPGSHSWKEHGMVMLWCDAMFMSWQAQLAAGELSSSKWSPEGECSSDAGSIRQIWFFQNGILCQLTTVSVSAHYGALFVAFSVLHYSKRPTFFIWILFAHQIEYLRTILLNLDLEQRQQQLAVMSQLSSRVAGSL